jgi:hypothetical protein
MLTAPTDGTPGGRWLSSPKDAAFHVFMDSRSPEPTYVLHGREALHPVFADLNQYQATTHFNGQSTIRFDGDRATGESYCIAHHLTVKGEKRTLMLASIRYLDQFVPPPQPFDPLDRRVASLLATTIPSKRDAHAQLVLPDQEPSV